MYFIYFNCQPPGSTLSRYSRRVRDSIADYEVVAPWGSAGRRYVCRAPKRLGREGEVLVSELAVDADGWQQLCDTLLRLTLVPGGRMLQLLEVGPDLGTGGVFVVTDTVPAGTLADPADGASTADRRNRLRAVEAAARGAHALHEAGLAHGSIQPGSVLLTDDGAVLDLPRLDAPVGEIVRVDGWSALVAVDPDLLRGESPGRSSDIWALGATLHTALTDRPLFPGIDEDEAVTAVQRILFTRPEPDPDLPGPLRDLITECVAADAADRPDTALAVAERLAEAGA